MAQYTNFLVLINGLATTVDISTNELATGSVRYGGAAGTLLTKTILDNLVALQNGSDFSTGTNAHTHDGRYFTETELSSDTGTSGSALVGDENTYSNFTPTAATVKGALEGIDAELTTIIGSTGSFSDAVFRVYDNGDITKQIALEASAISTLTTRTVSMPDEDVDLGEISKLRTLSGTSSGATDLGTFTGTTIPDTSTIKSALQSLETALETMPDPMVYRGNWAASTNTPTLADGIGTNGDVYYVTDAGTVDFGSGDIDFEQGDRVVYSGTDSVWQKWDTTDQVTSVNGQTGAVTLDTDDISEGATNKYFTDERAQDSVGTILTDTATIDFTYNDGAPSITADVKTNSINESHLTTSVAGDGLTGGNGTPLAVGAGTGLSVTANAVNVDYAPLVKKTMIAGESMAANTSFLVRWAVSGETAGRVYKATSAAAAADGKFWAKGMMLKTSAVNAGDSIDVTVMGTHVLGSSDTPFSSGDVGKPVWLTTAGAFSITAPTAAATADYKVGMVENTDRIDMGDKQLTGIN